MLSIKESTPTVSLTDNQRKALYVLLTERQKLTVIRRLKKALAKSRGYHYNRLKCGRIGSLYGWQSTQALSSKKLNRSRVRSLGARALKGERIFKYRLRTISFCN